MNLDINELNFINNMAEETMFKNWIDESCANFIGWTREFNDFSIAISRISDGFYKCSEMKKGYRASFNYKDNLIKEISTSISLFNLNNLYSKYFNI